MLSSCILERFSEDNLGIGGAKFLSYRRAPPLGQCFVLVACLIKWSSFSYEDPIFLLPFLLLSLFPFLHIFCLV
jgi:hypothetical protein